MARTSLDSSTCDIGNTCFIPFRWDCISSGHIHPQVKGSPPSSGLTLKNIHVYHTRRQVALWWLGSLMIVGPESASLILLHFAYGCKVASTIQVSYPHAGHIRAEGRAPQFYREGNIFPQPPSSLPLTARLMVTGSLSVAGCWERGYLALWLLGLEAGMGDRG